MTTRHTCSWQHQSTSRRRFTLKRILMELSAIWARHCSCLDCLTGHKEPAERGLLNLPKEMSAEYYGPEGRRWMSQWYRGTLSDCPGSKMSLSFLEFWKLLTSCLLM
ncbi:hypothetical protein LEMLEM_LOCUS13033 [Lemmus lemmus]